MRLCPKDENFSRHSEQFLSLWVGFLQPPGPVSELRRHYRELNCKRSHCTLACWALRAVVLANNIRSLKEKNGIKVPVTLCTKLRQHIKAWDSKSTDNMKWDSNGHVIPVIINKSYEERVEGIQVSDQYGELVHDEELSLGHLPPSFCLAVLFIQ